EVNRSRSPRKDRMNVQLFVEDVHRFDGCRKTTESSRDDKRRGEVLSRGLLAANVNCVAGRDAVQRTGHGILQARRIVWKTPTDGIRPYVHGVTRRLANYRPVKRDRSRS